jgi:hypothetical protein
LSIDETDLNCANVLDELNLCSATGWNLDFAVQSEITFCSSHFYELAMSAHHETSSDSIHYIIPHQQLHLFTEIRLITSSKLVSQ